MTTATLDAIRHRARPDADPTTKWSITSVQHDRDLLLAEVDRLRAALVRIADDDTQVPMALAQMVLEGAA